MNLEENETDIRMQAMVIDTPICRAIPASPTNEEIDALGETSYRRGFNQGAAAVIEAMEQGRSFEELRAWLIRVRKWRSKKHKGKIEFPEWLGRQ